MTSGNQTKFGKAFEFACLNYLKNLFADEHLVYVNDNEQLQTASDAYFDIPYNLRCNLDKAAKSAFNIIIKLEPQLLYSKKNQPLHLSLQADNQGIKGDVRDVLCIRKQNGWEIGFSCKHNHHAVKHSRLSDRINFGKEWIGISCSGTYFSEIKPIFDKLKMLRKQDFLWSSVPEKEKTVYKPLLMAFIKELNRLAESDSSVPSKLVNYLIGNKDFYKIITDDKMKTTRVEAVNIAGNLNKPSDNIKSIVNIPRLKLPSRFYHIGFKRISSTEESSNTVEVVCDEGWAISMRIHNASSKVEPSLKFDIQLISLPSSIYSQVEPWE